MKLPPRPWLFGAAISLILIWTVTLTYRDQVLGSLRAGTGQSKAPTPSTPSEDVDPPPYTRNTTYDTVDGKIDIKNKAAVIIDTQYTTRLIPLILHFHAVLGRDWPIVFYTSPETYDEHFSPHASSPSPSKIWRRAVDEGGIKVAMIPPEFDLTQREGVNIFLSRPWLWESLAPAEKVLVFQADSIICANGRHTVDDFLEYDFVGAVFGKNGRRYNGGLSLRNRDLIMQILGDGRNWEEETKSGKWNNGGEDTWFGHIMDERGGNLPPAKVALDFSLEFKWQVETQKQPLGYHKVHKYAKDFLPEIREWCPEIDLAHAGPLHD